MADYKKYPFYKDSGVEWLGDVPESWNISKIKHLFSLGRGRVIAVEELEDNGIYPVYSSQTKNNGVLGLIKTYDYNCRQITWTTDGANAGTVFLREGKHNCTNVCGTLQARSNKYLLEYMTYSLQFSTQFYKRPDTNGAKIMNGEMAEIFTPHPPIKEQKSIANYLDKATTKIDTLIEKQTKLIELLKEKRQAVISKAVTRGLDESVPMKDSGVEWLGEIPEHWKITRVKYLTKSFEQGWSPQCEKEPAKIGQYGVLKVGCVNGGVFNFDENKALPSDLAPKSQYTLLKDDLLISRANSKELVGSAAVVDKDFKYLLLCDKIYRLKIDTVEPRFISQYLSISKVRNRIEQGANGASSSMQNIGQDVIKELYVGIPPKEEVLDIMISINLYSSQFTLLINKVFSQVQLLKEKRTALISAAVTGKIDVRDAA